MELYGKNTEKSKHVKQVSGPCRWKGGGRIKVRVKCMEAKKKERPGRMHEGIK